MICRFLAAVPLALAAAAPLTATAQTAPAGTAAAEYRGTWVTRDNYGNLNSKTRIAAWMDTLAANHLNIVLVNVWSRGYPLFHSRTFQSAANLATLGDPNLQNRDVLAEVITEAHRRGLEVRAWFEYGFIGGFGGPAALSSGSIPIFKAHPDWLAVNTSGTSIAGNGTWVMMSHQNEEVQDLLVGMATEIARSYDIDGIQVDDHIGYESLRWGYDAETKRQYAATHNGVEPPTDAFNAEWKRWRADGLTRFIGRMHDEVKAVRPEVIVSNSPVSPGAAYEGHLEDVPAWITAGLVEEVSPQLYTTSAADYRAAMNVSIAQVNAANAAGNQHVRLLPGLRANNSGSIGATPTGEVKQMVQDTRAAGLPGHALWFQGELFDDFRDGLGTLYPTAVPVPGRDDAYAREVVELDDNAAAQTGPWTAATGANAFNKTQLRTTDPSAALTYRLTVPRAGRYELYGWTNTSLFDNTTKARYTATDSTGLVMTTRIDQTDALNGGWTKLGELALRAGSTDVVLSAAEIEAGKRLSGDAVMLIRSNRLGVPPLGPTAVDRDHSSRTPTGYRLDPASPNPFNPATELTYAVPREASISLIAYDTLGRPVRTLFAGRVAAGEHRATFNAAGLSSGLYLIRLLDGAGNLLAGQRVTLVR